MPKLPPVRSSSIPPLPRVTRRPEPSHTAKTWAPVSYTTEVTGLSAGQTLMMPQVSLQSGFNTPYLVDEIRFTARTEPINFEFQVGDIAAMISFQLQTGSYYFSQAALNSPSSVPMILYAPTYSAGAQWENVIQVKNAAIDYTHYSTRRWVLPKPLWMPPGDIVQATVSREVTLGSNVNIPGITAQMTVIGRALPPDAKPPVARCIPHVGWYAHPFTTPTPTPYSEANAQLQNPFKTPWHVQRIVMTTRGDLGSNSITTGYGCFEDVSGQSGYATVRLSDSTGYKITGSSIGGFVPLADVASPANDSAWTFGRPCPVGENFNVAFQVNQGTLDTTSFAPIISFVGYREEFS